MQRFCCSKTSMHGVDFDDPSMDNVTAVPYGSGFFWIGVKVFCKE